MPDYFHLTLAQLNPSVGDLAGNAQKAYDAWKEGKKAGSDMVALPEMFLCGYQLQDLVKRSAFLDDVAYHLQALAKRCADGPVLAIGAPLLHEGALYNAYHIMAEGKIQQSLEKCALPNTHVFDEKRYFSTGCANKTYQVKGLVLGSPICEDAWHPKVTHALAQAKAEIFLIPNGSPYARDKQQKRLSIMQERVAETRLPLIYLNMVGGQDDQVFDGGSFVLDATGQQCVNLPLFREHIAHISFQKSHKGWHPQEKMTCFYPSSLEQDYHAIVLALQDYLRKTGFHKVVLGLSGGIDSALVATIATDALGAANVHCVMLPSEYTSEHSLQDATILAQNLGITLDTLSITQARSAITETLAPLFAKTSPDITEENIQSRLRGVFLMALSNKFGEMLLTTGNKSEVAVGYATIYGDMAGGYNPLKDLYKTRVFDICTWRNQNHRPWMQGPTQNVIPQRIIDKPPSAELRPDQKDQDSLPPYDILDQILIGLIDDEKSIAQLQSEGFDLETLKKIERLIFLSEYKRFQSAPGPRLSTRSFWLDRRYPIVNQWRDSSAKK